MAKRKHKYTKPDAAWAKYIKVRAGWKCELCGAIDKRLHAHHLIPKQRHFFRHNPENGMCLCASCHVFDQNTAAHLAPWAFEERVKAKFPDRYGWWVDNRYEIIPSYVLKQMDYDKIKTDLIMATAKLELPEIMAEAADDAR